MSNPHPLKENQFKPGESGNPKGRPKRDWTWSGLLEIAMEAHGDDKIKVKHAIIEKIVSMGLDGDIQALKEMFNRMDGMPRNDIPPANTNTIMFLPAELLGKNDMINGNAKEVKPKKLKE